MKNTILNIDDMGESRIMLERKPPRLISLFVYFLLLMLLTAFLYSWFSKIEIVVKTHGTIRPFETVSRVRSVRDGKIKTIRYKPGQYIKQGEPLIEIDCDYQVQELERIQGRIDELEVKSMHLQNLRKSYEEDRNAFSRTGEREFYERFFLYSCEKRKLELNRDAAQAKYNARESMAQFVAKSELEELEYKLRMAELELQSFTGSSFLEVVDEYDLIKTELRSLVSQAEQLEKEISLSTIFAPISGTVNKLAELNDGDYLFSGMDILDIVPETGGRGRVEISISNQDIAGIKTGDAVSYRLPALPKEKYGVLKGNITSIPADMQKTAEGLFLVEGSFDNLKEFPELKSGMFVDVRITVRKRRILFHLLDKSGLMNNWMINR
ncbi:HlyD family secretion protein [Spirochaeta isovalerica]|uniref:Multidrug efflux pump subunit AcrA (Membrane-fusion protein) n=1 Tax=Spirochaeta isovalerica TaxID=150 RepID=A0A841R996_9SPIO|nr:HlyD family efflux transporter periplasmic adaptor subunit [Spirochaeta isovalerica]MBB6479600.1 multidrug efflux pump subunit AcrA (membrane-fusion protein) [Spirochaeta isovalerica]